MPVDWIRVPLCFLSIETFGFKALILPYFLNYTIRRNDITREMQANVPNFFSVIICSIFLVLGFYMSYLAKNIGHPIGALYFGISVATILTSLFLILARKQLITHVMGYLMLENGIFLLSFAIAHEMPLLINLGVLLDLFLGILLLGVFMSHIRTTFDDTDVDQLTNLKD